MDPATASMVISTAVSFAQKRNNARLQSAEMSRRNAAMNRKIDMQNKQQRIQENQQREKQKHDQATARATFGARGVASAGGSAGALVDGIAARTDEQISGNREITDLGIENLRANQRAQERNNLLQTQNSIANSIVGSGGRLAKDIINS